jgi:DNA-binding GntR family transcriptional regulator
VDLFRPSLADERPGADRGPHKYPEQLYDLRMLLETASVTPMRAPQEKRQVDEFHRVWLTPAAEREPDGRAVVGILDEQYHATLVSAAGNAEVARGACELWCVASAIVEWHSPL